MAVEPKDSQYQQCPEGVLEHEPGRTESLESDMCHSSLAGASPVPVAPKVMKKSWFPPETYRRDLPSGA